MTTTDPTPLAEQIAREHMLHTVWPERCSCSCGATLDFPDGTPSTDFRYAHAAHIATVTEQAALREAAEWLASTSYAVNWQADQPLPDALWEAFVDVVHEDRDHSWHGNALTRDDAASWLAEEAGRVARGATDD